MQRNIEVEPLSPREQTFKHIMLYFYKILKDHRLVNIKYKAIQYPI